MIVWEFVENWLVTNQDFILVGVVLVSLLAGGLTEFSKNAWKPLEEKNKDNNEELARVKTKKAWVSQCIGAGSVLAFLACLAKSHIGILGGIALFPLWFTLDFLLQYFVSCYGIKAIKRYFNEKKGKPKKEKKIMVKAYRDPETGELTEA